MFNSHMEVIMDAQHIITKDELNRYYKAGLLSQTVARDKARDLGYNAFFVIDTRLGVSSAAPKMILHKAQ